MNTAKDWPAGLAPPTRRRVREREDALLTISNNDEAPGHAGDHHRPGIPGNESGYAPTAAFRDPIQIAGLAVQISPSEAGNHPDTRLTLHRFRCSYLRWEPDHNTITCRIVDE
jgi:hypothetical protein